MITPSEILLEAESIAQLGSWVWDFDSDRLSATAQLWRIFDLPPTESARIEDTFLKRVHTEDYDRLKELLTKQRLNPKPFEEEFKIVRTDRTERLVRAKTKIVYDAAKSPIRMFGTLQDITELKLLKEKHQENLIRMFQNFAHQIKGPATQALVRAQHALDSLETEREKCLVRPVRGLCRKVKRVTFSLHILADMESNSVNFRILDTKRLVKMLIEAAQDAELTIEDYRNVVYLVDRDSFRVRSSDLVRVDYDLLEQCIGNLYDNAAKYSYPNSKVHVYGGYTTSGRFQIAVASTGIPLMGSEVRQCVMRGWRSEQAKFVTGEGSGIGLYVVDKAMGAMGAQLVVVPTEDNVTEFKLTFPAQNFSQAYGI